MHLLYIFAILPVSAFARLNGHCTGTATGSFKHNGICDYTSDCTARGGVHITGGCPNDSNSITCCLIGLGASSATNPCNKYSFCDWTANSDCGNAGGSFKNGYCPGDSDYKCCKY